MNNFFKKAEGARGERIASNYLKKKGYKIIENNFLMRGGELDIIAIHKDTTVFIEVKTRTSHVYGTPLESITPWKIKSLIKTAQFYMLSHKNMPEGMRIDAMSVLLQPDGSVDIEHVENITG